MTGPRDAPPAVLSPGYQDEQLVSRRLESRFPLSLAGDRLWDRPSHRPGRSGYNDNARTGETCGVSSLVRTRESFPCGPVEDHNIIIDRVRSFSSSEHQLAVTGCSVGGSIECHGDACFDRPSFRVEIKRIHRSHGRPVHCSTIAPSSDADFVIMEECSTRVISVWCVGKIHSPLIGIEGGNGRPLVPHRIVHVGVCEPDWFPAGTVPSTG